MLFVVMASVTATMFQEGSSSLGGDVSIMTPKSKEPAA
jgi:hypothetical protein